MAIENMRQMTIENFVSNDFDPGSSVIKSDLDCRLSGVMRRAIHRINEVAKIYFQGQRNNALQMLTF